MVLNDGEKIYLNYLLNGVSPGISMLTCLSEQKIALQRYEEIKLIEWVRAEILKAYVRSEKKRKMLNKDARKVPISYGSPNIIGRVTINTN